MASREEQFSKRHPKEKAQFLTPTPWVKIKFLISIYKRNLKGVLLTSLAISPLSSVAPSSKICGITFWMKKEWWVCSVFWNIGWEFPFTYADHIHFCACHCLLFALLFWIICLILLIWIWCAIRVRGGESREFSNLFFLTKVCKDLG